MSEDMADRLSDAMGQYPPHYDEVFLEVNSHIGKRGEAGKLELAALICWKRSGQGHWVSDLMLIPDDEVRTAIRKAFAASADQDRLDALSPLPGTKYAIATAVLAAYDPVEFGVLDRRALTGLERIRRPVARGRGVPLRYLDRVRELRDELRIRRPGVTARNIDQALWEIGG